MQKNPSTFSKSTAIASGFKLDQNGREEQEKTSLVLTQGIAEAVLLLIGLVFAGLVLLLFVNFSRAMAKVPWTLLSPSHWVVTTIVLSLIIYFFRSQFSEAVETWVSAAEHAMQRILGTVLMGVSELFHLNSVLCKTLYWMTVLLTAYVAWLYASYFVDNSPYLKEVIDVVTGQAKDFKDLRSALSGAGIVSGFFVLLAIPLRMVFSQSWRKMILRPLMTTVNLDELKITDDGIPLRIAHLSDIHAQHPKKKLSENNRSLPKGVLRKLFRGLSNDRAFDAVVISGDLTDDGSIDAWNTLLGRHEFKDAAKNVVIAPGNHDLNEIATGFLPSILRLGRLSQIGRNQRALRYLRAANLLMGQRTNVICPLSGCFSTLHQVIERVEPDLQRWDSGGALRANGLVPAELLEQCFPMVVTTNSDAVSFVVWNSVKPNRWPAMNSIGELTQKQIERADRLLATLPAGRPLIHVMHHQLGLPRRESLYSTSANWFQRIGALGMALGQPSNLMNWLARRSQHTVLLHGHHHKFFVIEHDPSMATVISAPSATQGVEESYSNKLKASKSGSWLELSLRVVGPHVRVENVAPRII